jgi:dCTP deaminase
MILSDRQIREAHEKGEITIEPFDEEHVQPASYDLRVGDKGAATSSKKVVNIKDDGYILLQAGDLALITVLEEIRLGPQYAARFGLRSKYARKGLIATSGAQIDPGYHGRLIIGLANLTPSAISLPHKDDFLTLEFHKLSEPSAKPYSGPYQDKLDLGPEEIEAVTEREGLAFSEVLTTLRSLSSNVGILASEVKTLYWLIPTVVGIGIAVIGVIVAIK